MNKKEIALALTPILFALSHNAHAALASNAVLDFDSGAVASCVLGTDSSTSTGCIYDAVSSFSGSYFGLDADADGVFLASDLTAITSLQGIRIGQTQRASGSHGGTIDGTESPAIDNPWVFFASTGMHQTTSDVNILSDDSVGNVTLDFSGWGLTWNGLTEWSMGDPANFAGDTNIATLTCSVDCSYGDSFILEYAGHSPLNDPSGIGGVPYYLYMEGTVSAVPVPAAIWLFGSGLLGLVGWSKSQRRQA